jgi:hypothetical protein
VNYQPKPVGIEDAARALLDPSAPVTDPALQFVQIAMSGFGYNFYDARNVARANDQLVRGRSSDALGAAGATLDRLQKAYTEFAFPAATREQPYPPADVMHNVRAIEALRKRALALSSGIAAAETPATDAVWFRCRDEGTVLRALVAYDVGLITGADAVNAAADILEGDTVGNEALAGIDAELKRLEHLFAGRRDLLRGGTPPAPGTILATT